MNNPVFTSLGAAGRVVSKSFKPDTKRISLPLPLRHQVDLRGLVQAALEGIGASNTPCEEDILFNEAMCMLAPPGTEDDQLMDESGSRLPVDGE